MKYAESKYKVRWLSGVIWKDPDHLVGPEVAEVVLAWARMEFTPNKLSSHITLFSIKIVFKRTDVHSLTEVS